MTATPRLRFDRHELAGAFGDIGTDLPLLLALVGTCHLDAASVFAVFGVLQIATGLAYGMPMPVQPLKAMAAIMLAQKLSAGTLAGGGLVIGVTMLVLATTGLLDWIARVVPKEVVRGIQLGLGLSLATLGLKDYVVSDGARGMTLAVIATLLLIALRGGRRRVPAPLLVMGLGLVYALVFHVDVTQLGAAVGVQFPSIVLPTQSELLDGALLLALPQLPLSLGNSVIATSRATEDLFPERPVSVRRIGLTYGLMNVVAPWFGGVPTCHGCGGLVGFHAFGARTGGAAVIYGGLYLVLGLVFAPGIATVVKIFPMPVLGVVLLFEALALMLFIRDVASEPKQLYVVLAVAAAVVGLKYGYVVGLLGGTALALALRKGLVTPPGPA
ncbi:MAG: molybdate transporter family protein [Myxococcaceae bacterium]|nr:molybdate transporter family protein [Myxococcaceae bacterium]